MYAHSKVLLGPVHQLDTEIAAILVEHGISVSQASQGFSEGSLKEMPIDTAESPWKPEEVSAKNSVGQCYRLLI